MDGTQLFWLAPAGSLLALAYSYYFYTSVKKLDLGNEKSKIMDEQMKEGVNAYLSSQFKVVCLFFILVFAIFAFLSFVLEIQNPWIPIAFLSGGFFSALSSYLGLKLTSIVGSKTAFAADTSTNSAMQLAFKSSLTTGLIISGLALLDITIWWKILNYILANKAIFQESLFAVNNYTEITTIMLSFAIGASFQSLFSKIGGSIFASAANKGSDLINKSESQTIEQELKNPGLIATNIGGYINSAVGTGADLYESYVCSILATATIGAAVFAAPEAMKYQLNSILLPAAIASVGLLFSILATYFVKTKEDATPKEILRNFSRGNSLAALLTAIACIGLINLLLPEHFKVLGSVATGLALGIVINWTTNFYTAEDYDPTERVAKNSAAGAGSYVLEGISAGISSTLMPSIAISFGLLLSYAFADGFSNPLLGFYGIGVAGVSMISTLSIALSASVFGSIIENGKRVEISSNATKRMANLGFVGRTNLAISKGLTIAASTLIAIALLGAYFEEIRAVLVKAANFSSDSLSKYIFPSLEKAVLIEKASFGDIISNYDISVLNPSLILGVFLGIGTVTFLCIKAMKTSEAASNIMLEEGKRQLKNNPEILKGEAKPDYSTYISVSASAVQRSLIIPGIMAILILMFIGLCFGVAAVIGMIIGSIITGFTLSTLLSNSGSAMSNANALIESGQLGGKNSDNHRVSLIGAEIGNLVKDLFAPSTAVSIKLIIMIAIATAGFPISYSSEFQNILGLSPKEIINKKAYAKAMGIENSLNPIQPQGYKSSIYDYEDPLLGTEDIIMPTDDDMLRIKKPQKQVAEEKAKEGKSPKEQNTTTLTSTEKQNFDSGFGGGFDTGFDSIPSNSTDSQKASGSGFDSGFGGGFDSGFDSAPSSNTDSQKASSSGFDSSFGGGFDSVFDSAPSSDTDSPKASGSGFDSGFGDGFDSFDQTPAADKNNESKIQESKKPSTSEQPVDQSAKSEASSEVKTNEAPTTNQEPKETDKTEDTFSGGFDAF